VKSEATQRTGSRWVESSWLDRYSLMFILLDEQLLEQLVDERVRRDATLLGDVIYPALETDRGPLDKRQPVRDGRLPGSGSWCHEYIVSQRPVKISPPCGRRYGDLVRYNHASPVGEDEL
jgi:hypothetical protein